MESKVVAIFSSVDFWAKLVVLIVTGYFYRILRQLEKDIERLYEKSRECKKELEDTDAVLTEHIGWHKGKGDQLQ